VFALAVSLREKGVKTALLSNTEKPAMQYFHELDYDMFDVKVFSCAEGVIKPKREIYQLTVGRLGTKAERSVFIDDKTKYINGAQQAGLGAILFESVSQIKSELAKQINLGEE
jgi:putative hydrolase of the HAD superfamily